MTPAQSFIAEHTRLSRPSLVPELLLYLADEITPIWQASEDWLAERGVEPPFWAFAWPGGQAMARYLMDHPGTVRGRTILDFAAGCGIAGMAAARAGAVAEACDIDRLALEAIALNARANDLTIRILEGDVVGSEGRWDLIMAGDVCYEAPMTRRILPWLRQLAARVEVWIADPGRAYLPEDGLEKLATYTVPTTRELEDHTHRRTTIYRLHG